MDDLGAMIGSIMNDPQKMEQLRSVAQSLGLPAPPANNAPPPQPSGANGGGNTGGGFDPAMLASVLQGLGGMGGGNATPNTPPAAPQPQPQSSGGGFDPGMLASILQGLGGGGGNTAGGATPASGGINLGSIAKISEIMNVYNQNDKNVDLLRTLKPHFSPTRSGRIDDAIRIMQLMRAWPVLRDSGLLSGLGGLGNLFGGGGGR